MFRFLLPAVLVGLAAFAFVDNFADACAPTSMGNSTGRKKRSIEDDVHVVVLSSEVFDLSKNVEHMKKVEEKLKEFSVKEGIAFSQLQEYERTAENVGGMFGVHFTVEGQFEKCGRILQFIQSATNEIKEVVSGTVKCGAFDSVHVSKKVGGKKSGSPVLEAPKGAEERETENL